jgi:protein-glutamine gamma-glutamyltransferase
VTTKHNQSQQAATFLLALLATLTLEFARWPYASRPWIGLLTTSLALGIAIAFGRWFGKRRERPEVAATVALAFIGVMSLAPFLGELLARRIWLTGESPEIIQMLAMRNLMLALTAVGTWPVLHRLSAVLSLFLTLGALMFMASWPGYVSVLLYGIVGMWWLMGLHWERMRGRFPASTCRQFPVGVGAASIVSILAVSGLAALVLAGTNTSVALGGYFWGSGGSSGNDPFAARGVWDGDQLVAATDEAASFGAVESDLFLDSEMPSLYDMFNDMYGEPIRKQKEQERAIGLAANPDPPKEQETAESQGSGREFATLRQPPRRRPKTVGNKSSPALIYVGGRVPLHLRLETFDTFDGHNWSHAANPERLRSPVSLRMNTASGKPWCEVARLQESACLCPPELHVIKVVRLATNRIPTPAHPLGVHIDKVDQRDFYDWASDDVLTMPVRDRIPPLQVIHLRSRSLDTERMPEAMPAQAVAPEYLATPATASTARIEKLARQWTSGVPAGYPQVAAIVAHLRGGEFTLDNDATVADESTDAAERFLFQTQQGPDYLFATSAAMMLRSLGYPARVATGLYVNPARYDRLTGQTAVLREDVHFWVEVCLDGHTWITVEPTPGYDVLRPNRTWAESLLIACSGLVRWLAAHPITTVLALLLALLIAIYRREVLNAGYTLAWLACQFGSPRKRLLATIWLIEWRAALAGRARPPHATLANWYSDLARSSPSGLRSLLEALLQAANGLLYSPAGVPNGSPFSVIDDLCRRAVFALSLPTLRALPLPDRSNGDAPWKYRTTA